MKLLKLLKYEIWENLPPILTLNGVVLLLMLIMKLARINSIESVLSLVFFAIVPFGILIANVFLVIVVVKSLSARLFTSEGYLTLSLPVGIDTILIAKILANLFWIIISAIVAFLWLNYFMYDAFMGIEQISYIVFNDPANTLLLFIFLIFRAIWAIVLVLLVLSILNIGKITRMRPLIGVIIFITLLIIENGVLGAVVDVFWGVNVGVVAIATSAIITAIYYAITRFLIINKLEI